MYFFISMILFITSIIIYRQTGDFDQFWKLLLISGLFGLCDSILDLSPKKFVQEINNFNKINKNKSENNENYDSRK